ncbi:MAG TPA: hypothetical protein VGT24_13655 [Candidatus Acidoferrales bacterium]|nr:hypothetical protein [Candidatus Acidoferrales bacterium]
MSSIIQDLGLAPKKRPDSSLNAEVDYLDEEILIAVRKLYPTLTESEAKKAGQTLCRYFEIVCEIQDEGVAAHGPQVDTVGEGSSIRERSNSLKT